MVYCKCVTKPFTVNGECSVCKRPPAPHDDRSAPIEFYDPLLYSEWIEARKLQPV